jgi:hypothetical protein
MVYLNCFTICPYGNAQSCAEQVKPINNQTVSHMRKYLICLFAISLMWGCKKEKGYNTDSLNLSGIRKGNKTEIVNVKLKSGETESSEIECYVYGSTIFEPSTSGFGYVDCNSNFKLVNPQTGTLIKEFLLPGLLSQTVIDTAENSLIGHYVESDSNYVVKLDLKNGMIKANNSVNLGEGVFTCTYFYNSGNKEYVLLRADSTLISINTDSGTISKSVKLESIIDNAKFDKVNNKLIGITYSSATDKNYIEIIDIKTGALSSKVEIKKRNDYYGCVSGLDELTNCFIIVNPKNEILFIDIQSGEIKDSYKLDFEIQEFKFWRNK